MLYAVDVNDNANNSEYASFVSCISHVSSIMGYTCVSWHGTPIIMV